MEAVYRAGTKGTVIFLGIAPGLPPYFTTVLVSVELSFCFAVLRDGAESDCTEGP